MTIGLEARAWADLQFSKHGFWSTLLLWAHLRAFFLGHRSQKRRKGTHNRNTDTPENHG